MKKYFLLIMFFFVPYLSNAQYFNPKLHVIDPEQFGRNMGDGKLDSVEIEVTPLGLTTQFDYTFKLSSYDENSLTAGIQYEILYRFKLPDNAFVKDSWLWVEDTLVVADIRDAWTANSIYEGIVNRRKDPSILNHINNHTNTNDYELRVYPYIKGKPRKVRISFCVYNEYKDGLFDAKFPILNMLNTQDEGPLSKFNLKINLNEKFEFHHLNYFAFNNMTSDSFTKIGNTLNTTIGLNLKHGILGYAGLYFKPKMENGYFININEHSPTNDKYYELLIDLASLNLNMEGNKYLFIVDYNQEKTIIEYNSLIDALTNFIRNNLTLKDKFNIISSSTNDVSLLSETWLDYNQENFDKAGLWLNSITPNYDYNIEQALEKAADFFIDSKSNGLVFTLSSSDHLGASSNQSINFIASKFNLTKTTLNTISFANKNIANYDIGNKRYKANEYFFSNLANLTRGNYIYSNSLNDIAINISNMISQIFGNVEGGEVTLSSQNALAFQKRDLNEVITSKSSTPIYVETGKIFGELPFQFKFTGIYRNNLLTTSSPIINKIDSIGRFAPTYQIWKSREINRLEQMNLNTKEHNWSIVDHSLESRVLSYFTSFLALEPWMMKDNNPTEREQEDEKDVTLSIGEIELQDAVNIEIFPNPVETKSVINIKTDYEFVKEKMEVVLFDYTGKVIKNMGLQTVNTEFTFDNIDDEGNKIASGQYLLIFKSKYGTLSKTLVIK